VGEPNLSKPTRRLAEALGVALVLSAGTTVVACSVQACLAEKGSLPAPKLEVRAATVANVDGPPETAPNLPRQGETAAAARSPGEAAPGRIPACKSDRAFPAMFSVPEASAAAEIELAKKKRALVVISDSGNRGKIMVFPLPNGPASYTTLPLDPQGGDDLEGAAWRGGHLYTLTSPGGVQRFTPTAAGDAWDRDGPVYPIAPVDPSCSSIASGNCGPDYEGLCLRGEGDHGPRACDGYAASRALGTLSCVVFRGDKLSIDASIPPISLDLPRALSDCAFGAADGPANKTLLVTTNVFGGAKTFVVDEMTGAKAELGVIGLPNNEAVAIDHEGRFYEFMDSNGEHSMGARSSCDGW
jgi:hypothetical protein